MSGLIRFLRVVACLVLVGCGATVPNVVVIDVAHGWANNSVNAVVFRKNSLVSHGDTQFIAFYDTDAFVVLGRRRLGAARWELRRTQYRGNARDAHNSISIMVDGAGFLHLAWDQHNNGLRYARSVTSGGLEMGAQVAMTGKHEGSVSYPEFYRFPDGNLLFLYRDGGSGRGNLAINRYDLASGAWSRVHDNLISGEGRRNAYWQAFLDHAGTFHLSWVWRESPDVASNHDLAYARSRDGGLRWESSGGEPYALPITAASAEYALRIPQNSELINQTSMSADKYGNPFIASYWRAAGSTVPQYQVVYRSGGAWKRLELGFRTAAFSLSGQGTKAIPIARPQIMLNIHKERPSGLLIFRDAQRGSKVSAVLIDDFEQGRWTLRDLTTASAGAWEPSYDTELWKRTGQLNLFLQNVLQVDGEGKGTAAPSPIRVLEWKPRF